MARKKTTTNGHGRTKREGNKKQNINLIETLPQQQTMGNSPSQVQAHDINHGWMEHQSHRHFQLPQFHPVSSSSSSSSSSSNTLSRQALSIIPWRTICSFLPARDILMLHHTQKHNFHTATHSRDDMMMWKQIYLQQYHWSFPLDTLHLVTGFPSHIHTSPSTCCWYHACSFRARAESYRYMSIRFSSLCDDRSDISQRYNPRYINNRYNDYDIRMFLKTFLLVIFNIFLIGQFIRRFNLPFIWLHMLYDTCKNALDPSDGWCWYFNQFFLPSRETMGGYITIFITAWQFVGIVFQDPFIGPERRAHDEKMQHQINLGLKEIAKRSKHWKHSKTKPTLIVTDEEHGGT